MEALVRLWLNVTAMVAVVPVGTARYQISDRPPPLSYADAPLTCVAVLPPMVTPETVKAPLPGPPPIQTTTNRFGSAVPMPSAEKLKDVPAVVLKFELAKWI